MAKGAAYETSYCRRGYLDGRAYTPKEASVGALCGCCPVDEVSKPSVGYA